MSTLDIKMSSGATTSTASFATQPCAPCTTSPNIALRHPLEPVQDLGAGDIEVEGDEDSLMDHIPVKDEGRGAGGVVVGRCDEHRGLEEGKKPVTGDADKEMNGSVADESSDHSHEKEKDDEGDETVDERDGENGSECDDDAELSAEVWKKRYFAVKKTNKLLEKDVKRYREESYELEWELEEAQDDSRWFRECAEKNECKNESLMVESQRLKAENERLVERADCAEHKYEALVQARAGQVEQTLKRDVKESTIRLDKVTEKKSLRRKADDMGCIKIMGEGQKEWVDTIATSGDESDSQPEMKEARVIAREGDELVVNHGDVAKTNDEMKSTITVLIRRLADLEKENLHLHSQHEKLVSSLFAFDYTASETFLVHRIVHLL